MSDLFQSLASETGIDLGMVQKAIGAAMAFLKDKLGADFGKVQESVPGSAEALSSYEADKGDGGGLMGAVAGAVGKLLGGGGDLLGALGKLGLDAGQIAKFLPALILMLQKNLPADLFDKVRGLLPAQPADQG